MHSSGDTLSLIAANNINFNGTVNASRLSSFLADAKTGDINVNSSMTVAGASNAFTFNAGNNINFNASLTSSGSAIGSPAIALQYGMNAAVRGNLASFNLNGGSTINLSSSNQFSTMRGSDGIAQNYTVITWQGLPGSTTGHDLQGMYGYIGATTTNAYVLGSDIQAYGTLFWNNGAGFTPIGSAHGFYGILDGLGHTISNLTINASAASISNTGLFASLPVNSVVRNVKLVNARPGAVFTGSSASSAAITSGYSGNLLTAVQAPVTTTPVTSTGTSIQTNSNTGNSLPALSSVTVAVGSNATLTILQGGANVGDNLTEVQ